MTCEFCDNPNSENLKYKIKDYKYWSVYLWKHPYYLGRCFIKLRRHVEDIFDIDESEKKELFEITRNSRDALKDIFGAEMMNYALLGNIVRHVHLHIIPRYSKAVTFESILFRDERWGKNHAPYDKKFDVSDEIKVNIVEQIRSKLV